MTKNSKKHHQTHYFKLSVAALISLVIIAGCSTGTRRHLPAPSQSRAGFATSPLPVPTRAPTATVLSAGFYIDQMRLALLRPEPDFISARVAWENAQKIAPNDPAVHREGARLALRQDDLQMAADRVNVALRFNPQDYESWLIAGTVAERLGDLVTAQEALRTAVVLNPDLENTLFTTRWRLALELDDKQALAELGQTYLVSHLDDSLAAYYRSEALLAAGYQELALELLLLRINADSPGVLWYTLSRIYFALESPQNAVTALEIAFALWSRGDPSFFAASSDPTLALSLSLGRAYVDTQRCAEAQAVLNTLATPYPEAAKLLEEAQQCTGVTPTPTSRTRTP